MQRSHLPLFIGVSAALGALLLGAPAGAQSFHSAGQISVALERGFGIHHVRRNADPDVGPDRDYKGTTIGLGWAGAVTPLHWARAAIDGFLTDQLSLGGSFGFFSQSGDSDGSGVLLAPRVGYAIPLSQVFTFWMRGGLTYYDVGDTSLLAVTGEAMFVASPHPSWGVVFGPTLDLGFTGETGGDNADLMEFALGLPTVGLMGTF